MTAFISYLRDDINLIDELCSELVNHEILIWRDREQLAPGQRWKERIHDAIEEGDYFIACFSETFKNKNRSYMHEELILAIEELRKRPHDQTWFIPISIDGSKIPEIPIGAGQYLSDIQWIDLSQNRKQKVEQLVECLTKAKNKYTHASSIFNKFIHIAEVHEKEFPIICFIVLGRTYLYNKQGNKAMYIAPGTHIKARAAEVLKKMGALEYYDSGWGGYNCMQEGLNLFMDLYNYLKKDFKELKIHLSDHAAIDLLELPSQIKSTTTKNYRIRNNEENYR